MLEAGGAKLYFSDCPRLPERDIPAHEALTFTIGAGGILQARYLPEA